MDQTGPGHQQSSAEKDGHPADEKMPRVGHSTALKEVVNGDDLLRDNGEMDEDAIPTQVQRLNGSASCEESDSRISIPEGHVTVIKQADAQIHRVTGDGGREYTVGADEGVPSLVQDDRLTLETLVLETDAKSSSDASTTGYDSRLVEEVALDASDTFSTAQGEQLECKEDLLMDGMEPETRTEEVVKDPAMDDKNSKDEKVADVMDSSESKSTQEIKAVTLATVEAESIYETTEVAKDLHKTSEVLEYMNGSVMETKVADHIMSETVESSKDEKPSTVQEETGGTSSKQEQESLVDVCVPHIPAKTVDDHTTTSEKKELDEVVEPALEAMELEEVESRIDDSREYETAVTPTIDDIDQSKVQLIENEESVSLEQIVLEESEVAEHLEVVLSDKVDDDKSKIVPLMEQNISDSKLPIDKDQEGKMDSLSKSKEETDHQPSEDVKGVKDVDIDEDQIHVSEETKAEIESDQLEIGDLGEVTKDSPIEKTVVESKEEPEKSAIQVDTSPDLAKESIVAETLLTEKKDENVVKDTVFPVSDDLSAKTDDKEKSKEIGKEEEIQCKDEKEGMDIVGKKLIDAMESEKEDISNVLDDKQLMDIKETSDFEKSPIKSDEIDLHLSKETSEDTKALYEKVASPLEETHIVDDSNKFTGKESIEKVESSMKEQEKEVKEKGIEEETEEKEKDSSKEKELDVEISEKGDLGLDKPVETMEEDIAGIELSEKKITDVEVETEKNKKEEFIQEKEQYGEYHKDEEKQIDIVPKEEHIKEPEPEIEKSKQHEDAKEEISDLSKYEDQSKITENEIKLKLEQGCIQQETQVKEKSDKGYDEEREKEVQEEKSDKATVEQDHEKNSADEKAESDVIQLQDTVYSQSELKEKEQECIEETSKDAEVQEHQYMDENKLEAEDHQTEADGHVEKESIEKVEEEDHEKIKEKLTVKENGVDKGIIDYNDKEEKYEKEEDKEEEKLEQSTEITNIVSKEEHEQQQEEDITMEKNDIVKGELDESVVIIQTEQQKIAKEEEKESEIGITELSQKHDEQKHDELAEEHDKMPLLAAEEAKELEKTTIDEILDVEEVKESEKEENEKEAEAGKADEKEEESIEQLTKIDEKAEEMEITVDEREVQMEEGMEMDVKEEVKEEATEIIEKEEKEKEVVEEKQMEQVDETQDVIEQEEDLRTAIVDDTEKEEEKGSVEADEKKEEKFVEEVEEKPEEHEEKTEEEEAGKKIEVDMKDGIVDGEIESPETIATTDEPVKEYIAEVEVPKLEEKIEDIPAEESKEEKPEGTKEVTVKPTKKLKEKKSKRDDLPKSPSKRRTGRTPPRSLYKKDGTHTADSTKQARTPTSPKKPLTAAKTTPSPKKTPPARNGMTSPARTPSSEGKKIPPIKAPVGQAPNPNLKNIKSKIGSLDNIKHKPGGGERKVASQKLEWQASSKIGSLEKTTHKPGGGDKKIHVQKVDFKDKAQSKVGSRENIKHTPGGGSGKTQHVQDQRADECIDSYKTDFKQKAASKVGSLDNVKHSPGGGAVKIRSDKLNFKERATSKIGSLSGSEKGSTHGSDTQSPIPPSSPAGEDEPGTSMPPVAENGEENGISPVDGRADEEATPETPEAPGETMGSPQMAQC